MAKRRGEVVSIKNLFESYKKRFQAPQKSVEVEAIRVIGECAGFSLTEAQVRYEVGSRTLSLSVSSIVKQELKIKNLIILDELKKRLGAKNAPLHII